MEPEIVVRDVNYRFTETVVAVQDMSFHVEAGEFVVIVGPSGCGKTTIENIIAGLLPEQDGLVSVRGAPPKAGRRDVAYMFAQDALLPWRTVLDNVLFGVEIHNEGKRPGEEVVARARELIKNVNLGGFEDAYPRQLSHGMRQRVALARTFLMSSPVLLMDEPFGALDAHTKLTLKDELLRLWDQNKRTVLFITHDLGEAIQLADRVLVCSARPGRIKREIPITLKRPRDIKKLQKDPEYHDLYQQIWSDLSHEMVD
jgi:NitT/TauT family transport system ATP-binding protein